MKAVTFCGPMPSVRPKSPARTVWAALLETATWMANADRAVPLNYTPADLERIDREAAELLSDLRGKDGVPVIVSGNLGPRGDAYAPAEQMTAAEARAYHRDQIKSLARGGIDVASGFTLTYVAEAAGMVQAAEDAGVPAVISFTVETDGNLPDGTALAAATADCDAQTGRYAAYYMVNCAHPEHFEKVLPGAWATGRLNGVVVNASRCSHAELDEADELDAGNPTELGGQLAGFAKDYPALQVFGGCCGSDARHLREIARAVSAA